MEGGGNPLQATTSYLVMYKLFEPLMYCDHTWARWRAAEEWYKMGQQMGIYIFPKKGGSTFCSRREKGTVKLQKEP